MVGLGCGGMIEAEFYLSAFLSATRAVTFALQASLSDLPGFASWYETERAALRVQGDWFVKARNASQKEGATFIHGGSRRGSDLRFFTLATITPTAKEADFASLLLVGMNSDGPGHAEDVVGKCEQHLVALVTMIFRCFQQFGMDIDPQLYYSRENLNRLGKSVEDFEEELGLPRGWTAFGNDEVRLRALSHEAGDTQIDEIFVTYLRMDRFGRHPD